MERRAGIRHDDFADFEAFEDFGIGIGGQADPYLRVSTVLPLITWTVRWSMAVRGTATPQLRLASILARANIPTFRDGLLVSEILTLPSWVVRSICGETRRTRPIRSGALSRVTRTVAPGLSLDR